jgi:hypothetical protein
MVTSTSKLTIDLRDEALHHELRMAAADLDRPMRDIVVDALRAWLDAYEDAVDARIAEDRRDGPWISLEELKARLTPGE